MYKKEIIAGTKLGLSIFMLEITASKREKDNLPYTRRKIVLITAR